MSGGTRKHRKNTFLQSALRKFKRVMKKSRNHKLSLRQTRKAYRNAKGV